MPTATETQTDAPAEQATESAVFHGKSPNLVLTRRSPRHVDDGMGGKVVLGYEEWMERQREKNHEREVAGLDPLPIDDTPWRVEFHHHIFKTDHPQLIAWLRSHPNLNAVTPTGFFESGRAPDEPRPTIGERMTAIAEATADVDVDALKAELDDERATHQRAPIIQAAEAALRRFAEAPEPGADGGTGDGDQPSTSTG